MRQLTSLGTRFRGVRTPVATVPYTRGVPAKVELPNTMLNRRLVLRLTGNLVIGTANAAAIFSEAPLGLIRRISVVGDGTQKVLVSNTANMLFRLGHYVRRKVTELTAPIVTVGTRAFAATIVIDHEAWRMSDPSEMLFDPRRFKKLELVIDWGFETDIATAGGGGGTIAIDTANTSIDVYVTQVAVGAKKILFERILTQDELIVVATQPQLDLKIAQAGLVTGILIRTTRDAGAGAGPVPVDDIVNTITLLSDTSLRHIEPIRWSTLQRENVADFQLDGGAAAGQPIAGYAFLDLTENGDFSSALNVNALLQTLLRFNVTRTSGTEKIEVAYDFAEPTRQLMAA